MSSTEFLEWVGIGRFVIPCLITLCVLAWAPIGAKSIRGVLAVSLGWVLCVAYTIYVYNPAGVAAGYEQGMDFPENRYDNNTVAVSIMVGWLFPLLTLALYFSVCWLLTRRGASNNSLKVDAEDGPVRNPGSNRRAP